MLNQEVDDLIDILANLRIRRETILRTLGDLNLQELELHEDLAAARLAAAAAPTAAEPDADTNPHSIGDTVTIGNNLRDEFGVSGTVIKSGVRLVTIRNETTRRTYTRAWWNLTSIALANPIQRE